MELTTTGTLQFNSVAKRQIDMLKIKVLAMMWAANLSSSVQNMLWSEVAHCANVLYNITCGVNKRKTPFAMFTGEKPKIYSNLVEFGLVGVVSNTAKIKKNWEDKEFRVMMCGYATNKSHDTY